jgi:hypothetical protein
LSQSQTIAVFIFLGFIVFITVRGELPQYRDAIFSGGDSQPTGGVQKNPADTQAVGTAGGFGMS